MGSVVLWASSGGDSRDLEEIWVPEDHSPWRRKTFYEASSLGLALAYLGIRDKKGRCGVPIAGDRSLSCLSKTYRFISAMPTGMVIDCCSGRDMIDVWRGF